MEKRVAVNFCTYMYYEIISNVPEKSATKLGLVQVDIGIFQP